MRNKIIAGVLAVVALGLVLYLIFNLRSELRALQEQHTALKEEVAPYMDATQKIVNLINGVNQQQQP
jgi:hypothetical protein